MSNRNGGVDKRDEHLAEGNQELALSTFFELVVILLFSERGMKWKLSKLEEYLYLFLDSAFHQNHSSRHLQRSQGNFCHIEIVIRAFF